MKTYCISYKMYSVDTVHDICVPARNKAEAYDKAVYEAIPKVEGGHLPYSAWVERVTYKNGGSKQFNTCEGLPY